MKTLNLILIFSSLVLTVPWWRFPILALFLGVFLFLRR
jgi:hypothetical protein